MFEINDKFYLNGKPFKIISGAFHYFRTVPEYWQDRLEKLVNMGCNTVETYIPWNFHEPNRGQFIWEGMRDPASSAIQGQCSPHRHGEAHACFHRIWAENSYPWKGCGQSCQAL